MCQALFLVASQPPRLISCGPDRPVFSVVAASFGVEAIRRHLGRPHLVVIGAHTGCSCGFRYEHESPADEAEFARIDASMVRLLGYLRELVAEAGAVDAYASWEGDWHLDALGEVTIHLSSLADAAELSLPPRHVIHFVP
jgi:hypothetical protein